MPALGLIACPWLSSHSTMRCMLRRALRPFTSMGCATLRCRSHYEAASGLRSYVGERLGKPFPPKSPT
ncbi:hypothetical protein PR002_g15556 [Phytophthora rubi]|uniref:Uncharacterized protein n=1 Tax=Phytophthora rubi TaxID=129364 RepID=A0A6A3KVU6_9STRA|nr:hypothetical protein PR002_g15556 [Phytophthora rubi]